MPEKALRGEFMIRTMSRGVDNRVVLRIGLGSLKDWTLALCLLRHNLVSAVRLDSQPSLLIQTDHDVRGTEQSRGSIERHGISLDVSRTELDACVHFFLRAFRDGEAEVDHLDLELKDKNGGVLDLTIEVPNARSPMTSDEARRKLGL